MSPDPLAVIWRCADIPSPVFTGEVVTAWPVETRAALINLKLLHEGKTADHVVCHACGQEHMETVMRVPYPGGRIRFFIRCPEHGRIEVERDHLLQWSVNFDPICRYLGVEIGAKTAPEEIVPSRLWRIGRTSLAGRSRVGWMGRGLSWPDTETFREALPAGASPTLFYLGRPPRDGMLKLKPDSVIDLSSVLSLSEGTFVLDRGAIEGQLIASGEPSKGKRIGKRDPRAATIKLLEKALVDHILASRDHAYATMRSQGSPDLLPRPTQKDLAAQVKRSKYAVSRALGDGDAKLLRELWQMADDLESVMNFSRR